MSWWGKALGGTLGFVVGGPLGALIGIAFGHSFDKGLNSVLGDEKFGPGEPLRVQAAFFSATFSIMGHIAKADGRVTEDEIQHARNTMERLGLDADARESAIKLFNEGKKPEFPLDEVLAQFRKEVGRRNNLIQMFIEIQIQAAFADGHLDQAEDQVLRYICHEIGIPEFVYNRLKSMFEAGFGRQGYSSSSSRPGGSSGMSLADAYKLLGVNESDSDAEIKKAYRRLMSQHHPDKLVAKGLPEDMVKDATEKTQQIRKAYEQIKAARNA